MSANRPLPHDRALPHLNAAFDCDRMRRIFGKLCESGREIVGCDIVRVKYRPGRNCVLLYRVLLRDGDGRIEPIMLTAAIYGSDEAGGRFRRAREHFPAEANTPAGVSFVPEHNMLVWRYPADRKLSSLPKLDEAELLRGQVLPEVVAARWSRSRPIHSIETSIAGYFPEHACCVRVDVRFGDDPGDPWTIYGKTAFDDRGARTYAAMLAMQGSEAVRAGRLGVARPLCYQPDHRLLWQEAVPGRTLEAMLTGGADMPDLLGALGFALGGLHASEVDGLPECSLREIASSLADTTDQLIRAVPALSGRLARLQRRLETRSPVSESSRSATLHGDLHLNNVLGHAGQIFVVDLDNLRSGDPAIELGSFIASMIYRAALHGTAAVAVREAIDRLLASYRIGAPGPVSQAHIEWHAAVALVRERMWRCLTSLKPGRFELLETLVDLAEALLDGMDHVWAGLSATGTKELAA